MVTQIAEVKRDITKASLVLSLHYASCSDIRGTISDANKELLAVEAKIESVPAEIIDPVMTSRAIRAKEKTILDITSKKTKSIEELDLARRNTKRLPAL